MSQQSSEAKSKKVEEPPELSEEDEKILDRIWNQQSTKVEPAPKTK